jgi:hypothetical protein
VRILAALPVLSLLLAGCALPEEEPGEPLLGVCPQWVEGPWQAAASAALPADGGNVTEVFTPAANGSTVLQWNGFPLDRYRLVLAGVQVSNATLEVRAFAHDSGQQRAFLDFRDPERPMSVPVLSIGPDSDVVDQEFDIYLTAVAHGTPADPQVLRLEWTLSPRPSGDPRASVLYNVTAAYRVCGAPLP